MVFVSAFCMWIMWICTWLHQWHPIIVPEYTVDVNEAEKGCAIS